MGGIFGERHGVVAVPVLGEEVVEEDIGHHARIATELVPHAFFGPPDNWMSVGEPVDIPVQPHPVLHARRQDVKTVPPD